MLVKEMHVSVEQGLQKIASNQYDNFLPDEIDLALNLAQDRYVKKKFAGMNDGAPMFQSNQKRLDDIRKLIRKNHRMPAIVPKVTSHLYEENMSYGILPHDYMFLVNDRSRVKWLPTNVCENVEKETIPSAVTEYVAVVPYIALVSDECTNRLRLVIKMEYAGFPTVSSPGTSDDLIIFDLDWFIPSLGYNLFGGLAEEADKYKVVNLVLEFLNRFNSASELIAFANSNTDLNSPGTDDGSPILPNFDGWDNLLPQTDRSEGDDRNYFQVYWEYYKDQYYPNSFVFVTDQGVDITDQTLPVDDLTFNDVNGPYSKSIYLYNDPTADVTNDVEAFATGQWQQQSYDLERIDSNIAYDPKLDGATNPNNLPEVQRQYSYNRLTASEDLYRLLRHPFNKTAIRNPLSNLSSSYLFVYNDGQFVIDEIKIDYIRQPRQISLSLAQSCELPHHTHQEIVDIAVEYILYATSNPRAQLKTQENQLYNI